MTEVVKKNKFVSFTYSILDENKAVVEQSDIPMEYHHGVDGEMFEKVEKSLLGKKTGDRVEIALAPEEGFGPSDPQLIFTDDINNVPEEYRHEGARPQFQNEKGDTREMIVTEIKDDIITIDGNHPFAGKTMTFTINIISIQDSSNPDFNAKGPISSDSIH